MALLFLKMPALPLAFPEPPLPSLMHIITAPIIFPVSSLVMAVKEIITGMNPPVFLYKPSIRAGPPTQMKFSFHFWGNYFIYKFPIMRLHGCPPFL
jgi:hypothetical protein